jgi:hypothetical protein
MSKKRNTNKTGRAAAQGSMQQSILQVLPKELLPLIAEQCVLGTSGHPMLGVSRAFRDAILSNLTAVKLELEYNSNLPTAPFARLLHRVCTQAPPGLDVKLDLSDRGHALPMLLQPGLRCGGWANVTALEVGKEQSVDPVKIQLHTGMTLTSGPALCLAGDKHPHMCFQPPPSSIPCT